MQKHQVNSSFSEISLQICESIFQPGGNFIILSFFLFLSQIGAKGVICLNDGTSVGLFSFATTENGRPTLQSLAKGYKLTEAYLTGKNSVVCKFTQTVNVPSGNENLMHSLAGPLHMLYASGKFVVNTGSIGYHGDNAHITTEKVDLTPAPVRNYFIDIYFCCEFNTLLCESYNSLLCESVASMGYF